jgi:hypothetical protein
MRTGRRAARSEPRLLAVARTALAVAGAAAAAAAAAVAPGCLRPRGGSPNAPEAVLVVSANTVLPGTRVDADGTGSTDADGPPAAYCFSFGEPGSPIVINTTGTASYTYQSPGTYDLRMVVFDDACPWMLLTLDDECQVSNEDELRRARVVCTRALAPPESIEVLAPPESGIDGGTDGSFDGGPTLCFPDALEPNDTRETATPSSSGFIDGLTICDMDVDYFSYQLGMGDLFRATINSDPTLGDLDAILIDPDGMFVAIASSNESTDILEHDVLTSGVYALEVFGFGGQRGAYNLDVSIF